MNLRSGGGTLVLLAVAAAVRLPTLGFPLTEAHAFRQTQTAFPAVIYAAQGIDLLHPEVPVFGPPWSLPFEFPLYQALASLLIRAGLPAEVSLRGLSLAAFLATGAVLWLLLERHATHRTATIALVAFLFSPFSLLWSRTSLVEYPATLGALLFVLGALEWKRTGGRRWLLLAAVTGSLAAAVKLTTAVFWIAPSVLTRRVAIVAAAVPPAVVAVAWTRHADAVKAANPNAAWLTSSALMNWNFGGNRLDPGTWIHVLTPTVVTAGMLLLPLGLLVVFRPERLLWGWMAIALAGPLLLFTNLYAIHDYYSAAVTPAIAALIGGGVDRLLQGTWRWSVVAVVPALVVVLTASYWTVAYSPSDPEHVLAAAAVIDAAAPENELVAIRCNDWSPSALYYARRRGLILRTDAQPAPPGFIVIRNPSACTT